MMNRWKISGALLVVLLWLAFCWTMLAGRELPGFRDSAYLYYPLFQWLDSQWDSGVPLWNPYCNLGMPNVGDNSPGLLYPGKLIFAISIFDFPTRYGMYVSLHILLAVIGAFRLARALRANSHGAMLAAISYGFGGSVLTQTNNVIFLVSAAWLPFALIAIWRLTQTGSMRYGGFAGICCAMMILGGDPQMVYHMGLIAAASSVCRVLQIVGSQKRKIFQIQRQDWKPIVGVVVMVITTILLSVVQVWTTYQWSRLSERAADGEPLNIYQAVLKTIKSDSNSQIAEKSLDVVKDGNSNAAVQGSHWRTLWETPRTGTIAHHGYQFSLHPGSLIELVVPNAFGKMFPQHQRWGDGIPGADRIWYPSIYMGCLVAWLGLRGLRLRGRGPQVWLTRIFLFFLLGSFGWYGLFWLIPVEGVGGQVGGVYWWMSTFLPNYASFRYPAKLFLIASLALSVLAGMRFRPMRIRQFDPSRSLLAVGVVALLAICFMGILLGKFDPFFKGIAADPLFGPFDVSGVKQGLLFSIGQTLLLIATMTLIARWQKKNSISVAGSLLGQQQRSLTPAVSQMAALGLIAITALDLFVANRWSLGLVPSQVLNSPSMLASSEHSVARTSGEKEAGPDDKVVAPLTIYRPREGLVSMRWAAESSTQRLQEIIQWQKDSFYPKHHFGNGVRLVGSFSSIWPSQYESILQSLEAEEQNETDPAKPGVLKRKLCDGQVVLDGTNGEERYRIELWRNETELVYIENDENDQLDSKAECELLKFESSAVEIRAVVSQPSQLVFKSLDDGNWKARIRDSQTGSQTIQNMKIAKTGFPTIGLAPGEYLIYLTYEPASFWWAAWVSGIAWGGVIAGLLIGRLRSA